MVLKRRHFERAFRSAVRHGDNNWADVGRWTLNALISAEELGVTQANVDQMLHQPTPKSNGLLGAEGDLETAWPHQQVGLQHHQASG